MKEDKFLARAQHLARTLLAANCTRTDGGFQLHPCGADLTADVRGKIPVARQLQAPRTVDRKTLLSLLREAGFDRLHLAERHLEAAEKAVGNAWHDRVAVAELGALR